MDDPCSDINVNDPIKNPEVTRSSETNINGGRFGYTRKYGNGSPKFHDGFDAKSNPNTPFTPIMDGIVVGIRNDLPADKYIPGSYGNYIIIKSILENGSEIYIKYNHLNRVDVNKGVPISKHDIIGLSGRTGNAKYVIPHIHIQIRPVLDFGKGSWRKYEQSANSFNNPENYIGQKFNNDGSRKTPCN